MQIDPWRRGDRGKVQPVTQTCTRTLPLPQRPLRRRGEVVAAEAGGVLKAVVRAARDEPVRQRELPRREAAVQRLRGREGEGVWSGKESSGAGRILRPRKLTVFPVRGFRRFGSAPASQSTSSTSLCPAVAAAASAASPVAASTTSAPTRRRCSSRASAAASPAAIAANALAA